MFTVKYYDHAEKTETASSALAIAKQLPSTYGQGNKSPVITVDTDAEANEMARAMEAAREAYSVRVI